MEHVPVLLNEVLEFLDPKPGDLIIDGTINGGGHSRAILEKILPSGKLLGVDLDPAILKTTKKRLKEFAKEKGGSLEDSIILVNGNYADLPEIIKTQELPRAEGLLIDLGFSSEQIEQSGRGFSFERDEPLLMTYNDSIPPVKEIIRSLSEEELADVIFKLGGERFSRRIAKAIKEFGRKKKIETSLALAKIISQAVPRGYERGRINPATRTFQALRIFANDELGNLERVLSNLKNILNKNGRVVFISFHSLEDRLVKNHFRDQEKAGEIKILTKKPIVPSLSEIKSNPRSRSAKLRAAVIY